MTDSRYRIIVAVGMGVIAILALGGALQGRASQLTSPESSGVPPVISYQGVLSDESGRPLTGPYTMTFGLYDVSEGGTALWLETQPVTATDGLFNVYLGATSTLTETLFDGRDLYLGVAVGTDSEMTPRTRVGSVPYAFTSGQVLDVTCDLVGLTDCDGQCVNRATDCDNCGACGNSCEPGYVCVDSVCSLSCPSNLTECGGRCVDTQVDPDNCGTCNAYCFGEVPVCSSGMCRPCY